MRIILPSPGSSGEKGIGSFTISTIGMILFCFSLFGCATTDDYSTIGYDINQLKSEYYTQRREITALKQKLKGIEGAASQEVSRGAIEAIRDSQERVHNQLTELNKDIQLIRGTMDENRYAADKAIRDSENDRAQLRAQLDAVGEEMKGVKERMDTLEVAFGELKTKIKEVQKAEVPQVERVVPKTPEEIYQDTLNMLNEGKTREAREAFEAFLKRYPETELSDNAQFWIAESFYKEGNYEDAILSYETLIKKFPKSDKVPGAMLKQAYAFLELGDKKTTKVILSTLKERFPKSKEAEIADKKLQELKPKSR